MDNVAGRREMKGLEMAKGFGSKSNPDVTIQRLNKLTYKVKSQSNSDKWYTVIKQYAKTFGDNIRDGQWICDCPDFSFRAASKKDGMTDGKCKHIHAVMFSKLLRKKVYQDIVLTQTPINQNIVNVDPLRVQCPRCLSQNYSKRGQRKNDSGDIQRYKCSDCGKWYIINPAFERSRASAKVISASIDMYLKGASFRKVADHIQQFYNVSISAVAICKWIRKWVRVCQPYADSFVPMNVGGVYHVDEMLLHVRNEDNEANMTLENKENHTNRKFDNHYSWLWNLMDSSTRLWICSP
jgi:transposase-like protein